MRVISGANRGTILVCPEIEGLRPTTDRVKENIFNLIQNEVYGRKVLDLFSGSGAMGIEALSRGAEFCLFSDSGKAAVEAIKNNIRKTRNEGKSRVLCDDYSSVLSSSREEFGLVFLDPPYHMGYVKKAISKLLEKKLLSEGAIIVAETDGDEEPGEYEGLEIKTQRQYGRVKITVYKYIK